MKITPLPLDNFISLFKLYVHIEDVAIAVTCKNQKKVGIHVRAVMSIVLNENDNPLAK